ncbi:pickpocket protein 28-like [Cydia fagiglandana]|uniref:pickpocket protein 28-like n=1 Tax=Cydia fagiglandana TaxID=1458189 RepID=UPI002FEE2BBF
MEDPCGMVKENKKSNVEGYEVRGEVRQRLLLELLLDFARNSSLHGPRYLTARGLHLIERLFWGIIFVTSVCLCVWAMSNVWFKWKTSPIIISVNEQLSSITEVSFPAVTVCPQTKVNQKYFNYTKHYITFKKFIHEQQSNNIKITEKELRNKGHAFMEQNPFVRELGNIFNLASESSDADLFRYIRPPLDHNAVLHMIKAAPKIEDVLFYGTWQDMGHDRSAYFTPVLMESGLCFTFNTLAANEIFHIDHLHKNYSFLNTFIPRRGWSPERGYFSSGPDTYPRRGRTGQKPDLFFILKEELDSDFICKGTFSGFKVYLHHPADLPQSSRSYYAVQDDDAAYFSIKVNLVTTSNTLINYSPHIRQCYFPTERTLHFFKMYTQNNCRLECLANHTLTSCGCVEYYMPRNQSTLMCISSDELHCLYKTFVAYSAMDDGFGNSNHSLCQCLPLCHSVQYEAEVVRTSEDVARYKAMRLAFNEIYNVSKPYVKSTRTYTPIKMYFKESRFVSLRRSELFGATDFLANCGGLLGLFLGFSFLSLVELLYFFTLRLGCMFRRQSKAPE